MVLLVAFVLRRNCETKFGNDGPMSSRSRQIGHVVSAVVNDAPRSAHQCSRTSPELVCQHPGHAGRGIPSEVSVKFFASSGVVDSKLMGEHGSQTKTRAFRR